MRYSAQSHRGGTVQGLTFSVVVITYNQEKYIAQTLDSAIYQGHIWMCNYCRGVICLT
mgnify:CR=1 FL=1